MPQHVRNKPHRRTTTGRIFNFRVLSGGEWQKKSQTPGVGRRQVRLIDVLGLGEG